MKTKIGVYSLLFILQGCTTIDQKYNPDTLTDSKDGKVTTTDDVKTRPYQKFDTAFLGKKVDYNAKTQELLAKKVSIQTYEQMDLNTLMNAVAEQTGISFRLNYTVPGTGTAKGDATTDPSKDARSVNFNGNFEEFMRYISALYDISATLDDNNVLKLDLYSSYIIKMDFFGENAKSESSLDIAGNASTSSGGLKGKSETKFESSYWDDVDDMAQKYISSGVYTIFKDASILTFSGRPSEYNALNDVLKKYQVDNNKQFVVTYKIYTLDKTKMKELGAGATMQYQSGGTTFNIDSNKILSNMDGGMSFGRNFYAGSNHTLNVSAQMNALYELTGNKVIQSGSFVTRNGTPIPLNMTQTQHYVSGRTKTTNDLTSTEDTSVETSELVTGTSFIITPRVQTDGRIEVTSGFTKRYLNEIQTFDSVQLPKTTTTEMYNTTMVSAGTMLMVGKYEAQESTDGHSYLMLGADATNSESNVTVVTVVGIDYYRAPTSAR